MWKSAYVGVYQLLNWKMQGETVKFVNNTCLSAVLVQHTINMFCSLKPQESPIKQQVLWQLNDLNLVNLS